MTKVGNEIMEKHDQKNKSSISQFLTFLFQKGAKILKTNNLSREKLSF